MQEVWKDIPNFQGYQVSNLARVRTYNKTTYTKKHGNRYWKDRIIKQKLQIRKNGRKDYRVNLWKDGKAHTLLVARLVAFTFFNEDLNNHKLTVNHKNGDSSNNNLENLEIIPLADNIRHAFNTGLMPSKQIKLIYKSYGVTVICRSMSEASKIMNFNDGYVSGQLKRGKNENKNFKWEVV